MTRLHAVFAIACIGAATAIATPAEASISRDLSRSAFSIKATTDAGPFAATPQLVQPSLTQELKAIEQRQVAAAECVALCDLSASVEAHPFGVASADPTNRSEDAWGNYRFTSELTTSKNRFGFTGHYWDKEASLYYAKARYYDPFTARFTQADSFLGTIDDPPSLHRYQYANANPSFFTDPTGYAVVSATETEALRGMLGRSKFSSPSVMGKPGQAPPSFSMSPEQQASLAAQVEALTNAGLSHSAAITIEEGDFEKGSLNSKKVLDQFYARTGRFAAEIDGLDAALKARIAGAKVGETVGVSDLYSDAYNYSADRATEEARKASPLWDFTGTGHEMALAELGRQGLAPAGFQADHTIGAAMGASDLAGFAKLAGATVIGGLRKLAVGGSTTGVLRRTVTALDELSVSAQAARRHLRRQIPGIGGQAHHIVPFELRDHALIQRAARAGFNINGAQNGIRLDLVQHLGSHPKYSAAVTTRLDSLLAANPLMSDVEAATAVQRYVDQLRSGLTRSKSMLH